MRAILIAALDARIAVGLAFGDRSIVHRCSGTARRRREWSRSRFKRLALLLVGTAIEPWPSQALAKLACLALRQRGSPERQEVAAFSAP